MLAQLIRTAVHEPARTMGWCGRVRRVTAAAMPIQPGREGAWTPVRWHPLLEAEFDVVGTVGDGRALLKAAEELKPNLVLVDVGKPLLNGVDAARQLTKSMPRIKIMFLSMNPIRTSLSPWLETKRGVEDSSFRTISNPYTDRALRVDYLRMMRKWRTDLYRYGLRLTFDITIPNPGSRFWAHYVRIAALDKETAKPFSFSLRLEEITEASRPTLESLVQVVLEQAPPEKIS